MLQRHSVLPLDASGYKGDKANRLNNKDYKAMFELHIEQGPILEAAGNDIGVVTCVLEWLTTRSKFMDSLTMQEQPL